MKFTTVLLLLGQICAMTFGEVFKKKFTKKSPFLLSLICLSSALLTFVVIFFIQNGFNFSGYSLNLLKFAIPFGLCFAISTIFSILALNCGDLSLTGLFVSFSLILPTLYGIIFLGDSVNVLFYIGLTLFFASLILVNLKFGKGAKKRKPITIKWLIFVALSFFSNGFCCIFQTMQQKEYNGQCGSELMITALSLAVVILIVATLITERKNIKTATPSALVWGAPSGFLIAMNNFIVMLFTGGNLMPVAIFFPVISGGGLILTFVLGRLIYKEKYLALQYVGIALGFVSIILLNL